LVATSAWARRESRGAQLPDRTIRRETALGDRTMTTLAARAISQRPLCERAPVQAGPTDHSPEWKPEP